MRITDLKCEHIPAQDAAYPSEPCCIDAEKPCFSFAVEGGGSDSVIKYYKILVSSSVSLLNDNNGDMWDSGIIYSSEIYNIKYGGKELADKTTYYFRVFVMVGKTALKSRIGVFHTGMRHVSSWKCGFIGASLKEGNIAGTLCFTREIEIKRKIRHAYAYIASTGEYRIGTRCGDEDENAKTGYHGTRYGFYDFTNELKPGKYVFTVSVKERESAVRTGLMLHIDIEYDDGSASVIVTDGKWRVSGDQCEAAADQTFAEPFIPETFRGIKPKAAVMSNSHNIENRKSRAYNAPQKIVVPATADPSLERLSGYEREDTGSQMKRGAFFPKLYDPGSALYFRLTEDFYDMQKADGSVRDSDAAEIQLGAYDGDRGRIAFDLPYALYMTYGDVCAISDRYDCMERYFGYLENSSYGLLRPDPSDGEKSAAETARFAADALIMKRVSEALGYDKKAEYYGKIYEKIRSVWRDTFITDRLTENAGAPLYAALIKYGICGKNDGIDKLLLKETGDSGHRMNAAPCEFYDILSVLCESGRPDAAYGLLRNGDYAENASACYTEWAYSYMLGIRPLAPGFSRIGITPYVDDLTGHAEGSYKSVSGTVAVEWSKAENGFELKAEIPANTAAVVSVPGHVFVRPDRQRPVRSVECKAGTYVFSVVSE